MRGAEARGQRHHGPPCRRQLIEAADLHVGLHVADLRTDGARRKVGFDDHQRAFRRVEHVVAGVAQKRAGHRGQPHLGKQPVDERPLGRVGDLLVEDLGALQRVAPGHAVETRQPHAALGPRLAAKEVEAGSDGLLQDAGDEDVGPDAERARLAERAHHPVLVEAGRRPSATSTPFELTTTSRVRRLTRVNRFTERFLPNRLLRPIWKNPRGANSNCSTASPLASRSTVKAPSMPRPDSR